MEKTISKEDDKNIIYAPGTSGPNRDTKGFPLDEPVEKLLERFPERQITLNYFYII